jgi:hypothetical protein
MVGTEGNIDAKWMEREVGGEFYCRDSGLLEPGKKAGN